METNFLYATKLILDDPHLQQTDIILFTDLRDVFRFPSHFQRIQNVFFKSRRVFGSACNVFIGGKCDKDIYAFLSMFWRFMYRRMFRSACNVFGGVRNVCSLICFFPALISRLAIYLPQNVLLLFAFLCLHHHHHRHRHRCHHRHHLHHHHIIIIIITIIEITNQ